MKATDNLPDGPNTRALLRSPDGVTSIAETLVQYVLYHVALDKN
ncbi:MULTISPECIES: hypothetical protein [Oscillatoriales]|nr:MULTISPECIES: hypothetical protein [Oscillatoriales]